ncbi:MAG: exodeoxyribonuclease V subunit gamma [Balneolaceae bacterium]
MFYKYKSLSLVNLAESFSTILKSDSLDPLNAPWVVVQNNEIKEWLSLIYAEQNGIAANFRFIFPSEFIWTLYRIHHKEIPASLPSDLISMQWTLFQLFSEQPDKLKLIPSLSVAIDHPKTLFQFCGQLADIFDQYQVYRPEMIELWLEGKPGTHQKDEKWQAEIWRLLNRTWTSNPDIKNIPRRSEAYNQLLNLIDKDGEFVKNLPSDIYVFGLSQFTKPFLEILTSLSVKCDIHLFSSIKEKASADQSVSDLFNRWNKLGNEQSKLLKDLIEKKGVSYKSLEINGKEGSGLPGIKIHSCHSKRREVEVLKNEMLRFLDSDQDMTAADMLILVPDAEAYAGTLETIMGNEIGEPALPLSNLTKKLSQSALHSHMMLLELLTSSFKANEVMQVMNLELIREKFGFTESDIDVIEDWVVQNNIFQGLGSGFDTAYSWTKGLNQLLAGFALETDSLEVFEGLVPFQGISSSDQAERAAKFSNFIHALKDAASEKTTPKKPQEWILFANRLLLNFIGDDNSDSAGLHKLFKKLNEQIEYSKTDQLLSYDIIKPWLVGQINSESSSSGRFGQGITVSTFVPYRSVPFKFIAMLGMNESVFPRKSVRPVFDLINSKPEPGDRLLKEDDTLLFLETIHAAQEHLHLSFEGQDQKTDNIKLPSILIQQLVDVLFEDPDECVLKHALHPFNKKYFSGDGWYSYSSENEILANQIIAPVQDENKFIDELKEEKSKEPSVIQIQDLIHFFTNPSKAFVEKELDIRNYDDIKELSDRESFKLAPLERYSLDSILLDELTRLTPKKIQEYVESAAMIPEGLAGEKAFDNERETVDELLSLVAKNRTDDERKEEIVLEIDGLEIKGLIGGICGKTLISYRVGKMKAKYLVEHWLKHLLLIKSGIEITNSVFITKDKKEVNTLEIHSADIFGDPLIDYIRWFMEDGDLMDKLTFFPESSKAFAGKILDGKATAKALKSAYREWEPGQWKFNQESEDYFNSLIWRGRNPIETEFFQRNALRFWKPFFITQNKGGE